MKSKHETLNRAWNARVIRYRRAFNLRRQIMTNLVPMSDPDALKAGPRRDQAKARKEMLECQVLKAQAEVLWHEAVIAVHGSDTVVAWKDGECTIDGEVFDFPSPLFFT